MDTTDSAYGDKLVRLDTFDTAVAVDPSAEDDAKRRFMTLILQTAHRNNGNIGHVLRATNTSGEVFAVKLLKDNAILSGQAPDRSAEQAAAHLANTAALFEEYRHLFTVSHLRGFPRVYGYGSCEDDPLILMEWVEGTSLKQALPLLPHDASGGLTTQMVAAVGNAVLRALLMTQGLVNPVVHRDLSPANIMFRTTSRTLEQQIVDCSFDPCLIDMGSATMALGDDTITRRADIWRFATPAYAAPEMLTQDIEGIAALRRSPAIDVYALSSILYQLYSGRKPFDFESTDAAATGSFYLVKTKTKPAPLEPRCEGDEALVQIIMKGLSVEQCDRPTEQQMLEVLSAYLTDAESEGREGTGDEAAIDIDSGTHLKVDVAGERAREILNQARHDAMTRRRFIIGGAIAAVAGLSVIGAATHGFGIPDYLDGIRGSLDDYTWDQLQEISLKIKAAETRSEAREIAKRYHLLDADGHIPYPCTKRVTLTNGLEVGAQLVGIRHDELLDGTGKAGLTFMFDAGIAERNAAAEPPSAGWADCELRKWLNGDGLKLLPNELRALIKGVGLEQCGRRQQRIVPERVARNPLAARHGRAVRYATVRFVCRGLSLPGRHLQRRGQGVSALPRAQGKSVYHERDAGSPVEGQGHLLVGAHGEPRLIGERRHALYEPRGTRRRRLYVRNACGKAKQANLCDSRVLYLGGGRLAVTGPLPGSCLDL